MRRIRKSYWVALLVAFVITVISWVVITQTDVIYDLARRYYVPKAIPVDGGGYRYPVK